MSVRSGLSSFVYPFNVAALTVPGAVPPQFAIPVNKGTYLISLNAAILSTANPTGVIASLQTTNAVPPGAVATIIFRNTALASNASVSLPCGAALNQSFNIQTIYTFPADTTCYLNIGPNGGTNFGITSSGAVNTITFTQLAP